jgi:hypothetical protein
MAINTTGGSGLYIGGTTAIDFTTDQSALDAFEAITDWIKVGEIEDLGEIGDSSADVTFNALGANRVRHLKGSRDAGTMTVVAGDDPSDVGQQALRAAEKTKFNYNFRIIYEDAADASSTDSVDYFRALVMSARKQNGTADNVMRRTFALGINSPVITVDSDAVLALTLSPAAGALTGGTKDSVYAGVDVNVSNQIAPCTFAVSAGALPAGITLNASTGMLSGTPTVAGSYSFTVRATDIYGNAGSAAYTLTVAA